MQEELFDAETGELQIIDKVDTAIHKKCYNCIHFNYEHGSGHAGDCVWCSHSEGKYKIAPAGFQFVLCKGYHCKVIV